MRYLCLALLLVLVALCGCTSLKRSAELRNPPPIVTGGGPMDPSKPDLAPAASTSTETVPSNEGSPPAAPAETTGTTTNEGG